MARIDIDLAGGERHFTALLAAVAALIGEGESLHVDSADAEGIAEVRGTSSTP